MSDPDSKPLVPAEAHTHGFRRTRQARRLELVEDYVELVADLIDDCGEARQIDIAQRLGVAQPTVAKMLKRLAAEGLISRKPYRGVFLTEEGRRIAAASRDRHRIVETFLRDIGISPETARVDAEGIEHHVSAESLLAFKAFSDAKVAATAAPGVAATAAPEVAATAAREAAPGVVATGGRGGLPAG